MERARQSDLRERNLAAVLAGVARSPVPVSRAGLALSTGLTRSTVSALVEALLAARLVEEVEPVPRSGAGRPAAGLRLSGRRVAALGAEVGVDYLAACVRDLTGAVRARRVVVGDNRGEAPSAVLARAADLAADLVRRAAGEGLDVVGAAWAVPGLVDRGGRVLLAPNLGWRGVDAAAVLRDHPALAGMPLAVANEASLAAVAELGHPRPSAPAADFVLVSGEVGIGAGLVLDGRLVSGERGWSGELGHVTVAADGPACSCGARGCLEVYAGQEAVLRAAGLTGRAATALGSGTGQGGAALSTLLTAATAGDGATTAALERAGGALGLALAGAVNLLDVGVVLLGGVYAPLARWLRPAVAAEVDRRALRARLEPVRVLVSATGPDAAMLGAAATVLRRVVDHPVGSVPGRPAARPGQ